MITRGLGKFSAEPESDFLTLGPAVFPAEGTFDLCQSIGCVSTLPQTFELPLDENVLPDSLAIAGYPPSGPSDAGVEPAPLGCAQQLLYSYCMSERPGPPQCAVVIFTDGNYRECAGAVRPGDAAYEASNNGIQSFAVGTPSPDRLPGVIEEIGEYGAAFSLESTSTVADVVTNLRAIRLRLHRATACEWRFPGPPPAGEAPSLELVNVALLDEDDTRTLLRNVADASWCDGDGWYWSDQGRGQLPHIVACPATCDALISSGKTTVTAEFGCPTQHAPILPD
jgi:hypothetical protein